HVKINVHYTSGLVLGRPMTLVPSFHCPRFFSNSTRSKRFKTLRLAVMVLAPFKLRCCDIDCSRCSSENEPVDYGASQIFQMGIPFPLQRLLGPIARQRFARVAARD